MSDELNQDELATIKARLDLMKVSYHTSIGVEKAREKLAAALADKPTPGAPPAPDVAAAPAEPVEETEVERRQRIKREALRLVRIKLVCMNPNKREWHGEIITSGNSLVGTVSKFIPFNNEDGWHVPYIIYQQLVDRKCQVFVTEKAKNGVSVRRGKQINEFSIEVLPPLTEEELQELAQRQAMSQAID